MNSIKTLLFFLILTFLSCNLFDDDNENAAPPQATDEIIFHTPDQLETYLSEIHSKYPSITALDNIGTSTDGRTIHALVMSDNPEADESEPKVRLTGSIHGTENATTEMLVRMINYLLENYATDNTIKNTVDSTYIVFIPMMNPDGVADSTRYNPNGVDLNRNFDAHWTADTGHGTSAFSEAESQAMRDYSLAVGFHTSLTFHTGAAVVNMPFDYVSLTDDGIVPLEYPLVTYMGQAYASSGTFLNTYGLMTPTGIINGGDWYVITGSMQDWSYLTAGCLDLTVEVTLGRPDTNQELDDLFMLNRGSMLAYIQASQIGVYGTVTDDATGLPVAGAQITLTGGDIVTHSDSSGYYHRLLQNGNYTLIFSADGYTSLTVSITAPQLLHVALSN